MLDVLMWSVTVTIFALGAVGIYIIWVVMYRTLRRYGVDPYSRGWRYAGDWDWVLKYKEICTEHGLSLRYWNLLQHCVALGKVLTGIWVVVVVVEFCRDMTS